MTRCPLWYRLGLSLLLLCPLWLSARPLILVYSVMPPLRYTDVQGRPAGPYIDLIRELGREMQIPLQIQECPLMRCLKLLEIGEADVSIGLRATPEREQFLYFLNPPFAWGSNTAFYQRREDAQPVRQLSDLKGRCIGVVLGSQFSSAFDNDTSLCKDTTGSAYNNFRKLAFGRLDVVAVPSAQGDYLLSTPEFQGKLVRAPYAMESSAPRQISLSRTSPWFARRTELETALRQILKYPRVQQLVNSVSDPKKQPEIAPDAQPKLR